MISSAEKSNSSIEPLFLPLRAGFAAIGVGPTKGYQLVKEGRIAVIKIGRKSFCTPENLRACADKFIAEAARAK